MDKWEVSLIVTFNLQNLQKKSKELYMRRSATFVAILKEWKERKVSDDDASRQEHFLDTVISNDSTDENITLLLQVWSPPPLFPLIRHTSSTSYVPSFICRSSCVLVLTLASQQLSGVDDNSSYITLKNSQGVDEPFTRLRLQLKKIGFYSPLILPKPIQIKIRSNRNRWHRINWWIELNLHPYY